MKKTKLEYIQNLNPKQENQTMNFHSKDGDPSPPCLTTTATPSGTSPGSQHSRTASEIEMKKQKLEYTKFEPKARKPNDEFPLEGWGSIATMFDDNRYALRHIARLAAQQCSK
jgi:hypothetical protein